MSSFCAATIPQELKERPQWVVWKSEYRDDKLTKIPYNALNGLKARANDRSTWAPYDAAVQAMNSGFNGVGFEFNKEDGITGIDFDECMDPDTGKMAPDVRDMVERLNSYAEVSQSGRGVHVFVKAALPGNRNRKGHVEMYHDSRFFAMTGDCLPNLPHTIEPRQDELNALYHTIFGDENERLPDVDQRYDSIRLENADIIRKASAAKNGDKFKRLFFDGDTRDYCDDDSSADLALCDMLAFWCSNDPIQIDSVFRESKLMRSKWDEHRGAMTYGEITIQKALALGGEVYQGRQIANEPVPESDVRNGQAIDILKVSDPIDFILTTYNTQHVGDKDIGEGILLGTAAQSVLNSLGVPSKLTGDSGKGKSHAARTMMHLHPQDYVLYSSLTDKAAWYLDTLKPGMTIFSDDVFISPELEQIIKRATSNFQRETDRVMPARDRSKSITQTIPPRLNWLLTSVSTQGSEELIKRQMGYDVDTSDTQDKAYIEFEKQRALNAVEEFPVTEDVLTCREILRILKENEDGSPRIVGVEIPFAERIAWTDTENRRNFNIFMDMVRSFAMLRFMQREFSDEGTIIATIDDFNDAKRHYGARAGMQRLHLDEKQKRFCQHLAQEGGEADTATMQARMKLSRQSVYKIADQLENMYWRFNSEKRWVESDDSATKRTEKRFYVLNFDGRESFTIDEYSSVVHLKDEKDEL
jgi:primase-polymerase (primpol)-like protein